MSGGIAYVYDGDGMFFTRLNREMVDLDELDEDDVDFLRSTIRRHQSRDGLGGRSRGSSPTGTTR